MYFKRLIHIAFIFCSLTILSGCLHLGQTLRLQVNADAHLNPSDTHAPLPVYLRVYQLKDTQAFALASYESLWKQDKKTLGDDLKSIQEYCILPDQVHHFHFNRQKDANYLGFLALYREPKEDQFKKIIKIPRGVRPYPIKLSMQAYEIN